jgi:hypothetical protein
LLWAAVAATTMTLGVPLSAWSDCVDRQRPMAFGWALHVLVFVGLGAVTLVSRFWVLAVGVGLYQARTVADSRHAA